MIRSVGDFIRYFEGVRRRTWLAVDRVTPALVGWRPRPDEWVHHRSQLDCWLAEAGAEPPQLYGYRMEDVVTRARRGPVRIC